MASSGSFQSNTGVACNIKVAWSQVKNTSDNTSTVKVTAYLLHNSLSVGARTLNIACMGQSQNINVPAINTTASGNTTTLGTATFKLAHNSDGSKSGTISATINPFTVTYSGVYLASLSASATVTLDSIPRESSFTVSASSVTMGENITISISRASSSYTHRLRYTLPNSDTSLSGTSGTIGTGIATSKQWTVPVGFANYTPNAVTNTLKIECDTYSGSTLIGTKSVSIIVKVPTSIVPSITSVSASPTSSNSVVNSWGIFVQNYSKAVCVISASGAYKATIKSYAVAYGGSTTSATTGSVTTGKAMSGTENSITVTVTDTRGRTASKSITVSAYVYSVPSLNSIKCYRSDSEGTASDEGTYVYMSASKSFVSCNGKNTATATYKVIKKADGSVTSSGTMSDGDNLLNVLSATNVYEVMLSIRDALGNGRDYVYTLDTTAVAFSLYPSKKGGAAFGKYAEEEETLDIGNWKLKCGNVWSEADVIAGLGTDNQVSLLGLNTSKQNTITGGVSTVVSDNFNANIVPITNASGKIVSSAISATKLGYLSGVTSSIQSQLDAKQAKLTYNSNTSNGYINIPGIKIRIAWKRVSWTGAISTAWGSGYESSLINMGNWAAAFSAAPAVSYSAYCTSQNADTGVNCYAHPSTTSAGSVYLQRNTAYSTSATYVITAIAIGTYS